MAILTKVDQACPKVKDNIKTYKNLQEQVPEGTGEFLI